MTSRREKPPIFAFLERFVKSQQGSGLEDDGELRNPACWNQQRPKTQYEAIERIQVRRPPARATADEQLVLEHQGFGYDSADPAPAHEFGEGGQQVDDE
jgi:hypothetical protein